MVYGVFVVVAARGHSGNPVLNGVWCVCCSRCERSLWESCA